MPFLSQVSFPLGCQQHVQPLSAKGVMPTLVSYTSKGAKGSLRAENVDPADLTLKATLPGPRLKLGNPGSCFPVTSKS